MNFLLHNDAGIRFPPVRPRFTDGEEFFGRFRALIPRDARDSVIGVGGTGVIHLVRDTLLDRHVALKIPLREVRRDPGARMDVLRETRHAVELTHPNIVRIHDFHEDADGWGISMQYIRGQNLDELRHDEPGALGGVATPFLPERVAGWIAQLLDALTYAHEVSGMVHRDIKPRNLMIEPDDHGGERLLVTDFGITRKLRVHSMLLSREQPEPGGRDTMGTLPYMPLSQIRGEPPSPLDDVYSIGATIYDLLTGRPPFFEGGYEQIRVQIETVVPPPMLGRRHDMALPDTDIPPQWEETVAACLEKDPGNRPQSIRELAAALGLGPGFEPTERRSRDLDRELESLREELQLSRLNDAESRRRLDLSEQEVQSAQAMADNLRQQLASSENGAMAELREKISTLETALAEAGENLEKASEEKMAAEAATSDLHSTIARLRAELDENRSSAARDATVWKNEADAEIEALTRRTEQEKSDLLAKLSGENRKVAELESAAAAANARQADLEAQLAKTADDLTRTLAELDHAHAREAELAREIAQLQATAAATGKQLDSERSRIRAEIERDLRRATARPLAAAMARIAVLEKSASV